MLISFPFFFFSHSFLPRLRINSHNHSQYTFPVDVRLWASEYTPDFKEADDDIHQPEPAETRPSVERDGHIFSMRGLTNLVPLLLLTAGLVALL